jgi:hypothetical protein
MVKALEARYAIEWESAMGSNDDARSRTEPISTGRNGA